MTSNVPEILEVENISVSFPFKDRQSSSGGRFKAVDAVSFTIKKGTITGIVGESGCGKTTLARAIAGFQKADAGTVLVNGTDLLKLKGKKLRTFRRCIQMIFQNPFASLDPRMDVYATIAEAIPVTRFKNSSGRKQIVASYLEMTGLAPEMMHKFPHEFSGGQRQRIAIARALAAQPAVIIADEPVSSLDVSVAAQILNLFSSFRKQLDLSMLFISHDLAVVRFISQNIMIMYRGRIVEYGTTEDIFRQPLHPYTIELLKAVPDIGASPSEKPFFETVSYKIATGDSPLSGCLYAVRCEYADSQCRQKVPTMINYGKSGTMHCCACFHIH